jgi:hypothetical protein
LLLNVYRDGDDDRAAFDLSPSHGACNILNRRVRAAYLLDAGSYRANYRVLIDVQVLVQRSGCGVTCQQEYRGTVLYALRQGGERVRDPRTLMDGADA